MHARTRLSIAALSGLLSVGLAAPAAYSMPVERVGHAPAARSTQPARGAVECSTAVLGFSAAGLERRLVAREGVAEEETTFESLDFTHPTGLGYSGYRETKKAYFEYYFFTAEDGRPRRTFSKYVKKTKKVTWTSTKMDNKKFNPVAIAGNEGWGPYAYISDGSTLLRYTWFSDGAGGTLFDQPKDVADVGLTSLISFGRYGIRGKKYDLLLGTTSSGALVQVRVPANFPKGKVTVTTLADTGFAGVDELSTGGCVDGDTYVNGYGLVTIDREAAVGEQARYWEVADLKTPHAADLSGGDVVTPSVDWTDWEAVR